MSVILVSMEGLALLPVIVNVSTVGHGPHSCPEDPDLGIQDAQLGSTRILHLKGKRNTSDILESPSLNFAPFIYFINFYPLI